MHRGARAFTLHLQMGQPRIRGEKNSQQVSLLVLAMSSLSLSCSASQTIVVAFGLQHRLLGREYQQCPEGPLHTQPLDLALMFPACGLLQRATFSTPARHNPLTHPSEVSSPLPFPHCLLHRTSYVPGLQLPFYLLPIPLF